MSSKVRLKSGETILVDDRDKNFVEKYEWELTELNGQPRIVKCSDKRVRLHTYLGIDPAKRFEFKNGNHLDYRMNNLYSYYASKNNITETQKKERDSLKFIKKIQVTENDCEIVSYPRGTDDDLLCATCSYVDLERYDKCLSAASRHSWSGWKMVSGQWCEDLQKELKHQEDLNEIRSQFG